MSYNPTRTRRALLTLTLTGALTAALVPALNTTPAAASDTTPATAADAGAAADAITTGAANTTGASAADGAAATGSTAAAASTRAATTADATGGAAAGAATAASASTADSATAGAGGAAAGSARRLRAAVERLVADGQPGAIVLSRRGRHVTHVTAGVADKATGQRMDARLRFRIASVTKTFTSTVLLQMAAERRVSLDDTVDTWLPGSVTRNGHDGSEITIRQLLGHTSGLKDYSLDPRIWSDPRREWKPQELVDMAQETPPIAKGTYSNTNYILAGMIIEKAAGRSLGREFERRIIRPLGMRHTSLAVDRSFPGPYVHGYMDGYGDVSTEVSLSSAWASGGVISTVDDVAKFHRALFTGRLLPRRLQREMTTTRPVADGSVMQDYGLGVVKTRFSCGIAWGHDGGFPGYRTWTYTSAEGQRQAVITYNDSSAALEADPKFKADLDKAAETAFCR
ncbi:serine hydrolase domain-containing protein [Actinomadura sp. 6N118]|uniref:serine hydrolase domain-containing protein n=1 Tax=Actinomadura sp. 6N118 TaxID=3375151 RepID=UPI0037AD3301